ncbi:hypothetical protein NOVA_81 [Mycobacterium phage Nova]|uniref:Uncharacterized protein n=1 Tax=Mycobacterium phage Nova TaxID=1089130 RepID=G8IAU0_9CAUD|nr:hypothetical protein NOVA_81 [Mycobacterium phage Nova]
MAKQKVKLEFVRSFIGLGGKKVLEWKVVEGPIPAHEIPFIGKPPYTGRHKPVSYIRTYASDFWSGRIPTFFGYTRGSWVALTRSEM